MSEDYRRSLAIRIRTLQIIVASLTLGPLIFLLVVVFAIQPPQPPQPIAFGAVNLTTISLGFAAAAVAVRAFVPATIVARARREAGQNAASNGGRRNDDDQRATTVFALWNAYMVKTIVGAAILEGTCFFLIVAYQLERQPIALSTAAAFLTAVACHFPTSSRIDNWIENQVQRVNEEQAFARLG